MHALKFGLTNLNSYFSEETPSLWLIDNESAFLSAYSLIYGEDRYNIN